MPEILSSDRQTSAPRDALRPGDAPALSWVDVVAPRGVRPYLRLMRADRLVGVWLLWLPCLWGAGLALSAQAAPPDTVDWLRFAVHGGLFAIGAFVMRAAGCAYNDIVDRDIDAQVARTAGRPLPAGQISLRGAWLLLVVLCLIGLIVLIRFNGFTILVGLASLGLVAAYPFMKRITWWPQAWLGLTFNWGVLVGFAAATGTLTPAVGLIYMAGMAWTLGYDTIYAHQDKDDDALIGVKSSARALGSRTRPALFVFYGAVIALFAAAGALTGASPVYFAALGAPAAHFLWQIARFDADQPDRCLILFKANQAAGILLLAPFLLESLIRAP